MLCVFQVILYFVFYFMLHVHYYVTSFMQGFIPFTILTGVRFNRNGSELTQFELRIPLICIELPF